MYRVIANEGFKSEKMPLFSAVLYANELKRLGNVKVSVIPA